MSAAAALARAEAAGVRFRLAPSGEVRMEAAAPPPPEVLAELRQWREDVAHLLAFRDGDAARRPVPAAPRPHPVSRLPSAPADWRALPYGPERGEAFAAARLAPGACHCCAGRRWWRGEGAQTTPRCIACHPPPPGLAFTTADR